MCSEKYVAISRFELDPSTLIIHTRLFVYLFAMELMSILVIDPIGLLFSLLIMLMVEMWRLFSGCLYQRFRELNYHSRSGWRLYPRVGEPVDVSLSSWWSGSLFLIISLTLKEDDEQQYLFFLPDNSTREQRRQLKSRLLFTSQDDESDLL